MSIVLKTSRLELRELVADDAGFLLELLNDPAFVANIGDRGVRSLDDARDYLRARVLDSYQRHGFGMYLAAITESRQRIGICGLVKRDALPDVDIGFALLPAFRGHGYALEAAAAVMSHARTTLGLPRVVAVVSPGNGDSIRLLEKLGLQLEKRVRLAEDAAEIDLYA